MGVEFIKKIRDSLGLKNYTLAKELGVSVQLVDKWTGKVPTANQQGIRLASLVKIRRLAGLSWEELGKLLDKEFGDKRK